MMHLLIPLVLLTGAVGRRIAGGVLNQWFVGISFSPGVILTLLGGNSERVMGDTPARLIYGASMALAALLGGAVWWLALAMVPAFWIGSTTGNFNSIAMGRNHPPEPDFLGCFLGMSAHAALTALTPVLIVVGVDLWTHLAYAWVWIAGLTMLAAPLYALAWNISGLRGQKLFPNGFQQGSDLGEGLWGAATALGVYLAS
jgi:hypothetical protein